MHILKFRPHEEEIDAPFLEWRLGEAASNHDLPPIEHFHGLAKSTHYTAGVIKPDHVAATEPLLTQVTPDYLCYVMQRVMEEGFHVERLSRFCYYKGQQEELIADLEYWVSVSSLKISFNLQLSICLFEQRF